MDGIPKPPRVVFMGGGGVGAVANPVIGDDGGILAIDLVNGGFGYKYPPLVRIEDESGIGAGAVVNVDVGEYPGLYFWNVPSKFCFPKNNNPSFDFR